MSRSFDFGITCEENLRLSYVADSGEFLNIANYVGGTITDDGVIPMLTSAEGLSIGALFEDTRDLGGVEVAFFEISFLIYASPLKGVIVPEEAGLSYWNSRDLMADFEVTPAPMQEVYVVEMDENGEIIPPGKSNDASDVEQAKDNGSSDVVVSWSLVIVGIMAIAFIWRLLWLKDHYKLDSLRAAAKKFIDDYLDIMKLGDDEDYDDYDDEDYDENDESDDEDYEAYLCFETVLVNYSTKQLEYLRGEIDDELYARKFRSDAEQRDPTGDGEGKEQQDQF